ncbi:uncharacterized protein PFL1_03541 [Pseudozyma flocculosa PF-1]|uniref:Uncharacterized protein n=2 Tax=Pseudozyma flocculosa TaxID=84751 RepID=A0A5C3F5T3_9BASI|nr:uncharacterized protein PFL1_03541 [Pseudozyma flocculosa PF-1]EPQ28738.1 hypothetical protein PFL1_03541 [Pseudozyma flocculosa PF-1]SPO39490.1 uncharacterized protein PSFLO_04971 [Pseudozyma flocculosa]
MRNAVSILSRRATQHHQHHRHHQHATPLLSSTLPGPLLSRLNHTQGAGTQPQATAHRQEQDAAPTGEEKEEDAEATSAARPYIPPTPPPFPTSSSSTGSSSSSGSSRTGPPTSHGHSPLRLQGASDRKAAKRGQADFVNNDLWTPAASSTSRGNEAAKPLLYPGIAALLSKGKAKETQEVDIFAEALATLPAGTQNVTRSHRPAPVWSSLSATLRAYPHLTLGQAKLLLSLRRHVESSIPKPTPGQLLSLYLDVLWQQRRRPSDPEARLDESAESLALLLRYAFLHEDIKTLRRLQERASESAQSRSARHRRAGSDHRPSRRGDWVSGWPPPIEPVDLGNSLLVTLAAKHGRWNLVRALMHRYAVDKEAISPYVWSNLIRHGLAQPAFPASEEMPQDDAASKAHLRSSGDDSDVGAASLPASRKSRRKMRLSEEADAAPKDVAAPRTPIWEWSEAQLLAEEDKLAKQQHIEMMRSERAAVAATFLPTLTSISRRRLADADEGRSRSDEPGRSSNGSNTTTARQPPSWLLLSTLNDLADRGQSEQVLNLVLLHLDANPPAFDALFDPPQSLLDVDPASSSEATAQHSSSGTPFALPVSDPMQSIDGTTLLNIAMRSHFRDPQVSLDEMLQLFRRLTSIDLVRQAANVDGASGEPGAQEGAGCRSPVPAASAIHADASTSTSEAASTSTTSTATATATAAAAAIDDSNTSSSAARATSRSRNDGEPGYTLAPSEQTLLYLLAKVSTLPRHERSSTSLRLLTHFCVHADPYPWRIELSTRSFRRVLGFCLGGPRAVAGGGRGGGSEQDREDEGQVAKRCLDLFERYNTAGREQQERRRRYLGGVWDGVRDMKATTRGRRRGMGGGGEEVGEGRERNDWRSTLHRLVKRGWIRRGYMQRLALLVEPRRGAEVVEDGEEAGAEAEAEVREEEGGEGALQPDDLPSEVDGGARSSSTPSRIQGGAE